MNNVRRIMYLIPLLALVFFLAACEEEATLEVDEESIAGGFAIDEFVIHDIDLIYREAGEEERIALNTTMLEDNVPFREGAHELVVNYEGASTRFEIELLEAYTVTFTTDEGDVISEETVLSGRAAEAPEAPAREGYLFTGWDGNYEDIQSDTEVTALYEVVETTFKEDFEGLGLTGSSYGSGSFIGTTGIEWYYEGARADQDLDGRDAMILGGAGDYLEAEIEGGMDSFSIEYANAFSGAAGIALYADGERFAASEAVKGETATFTLDDVDIEETFTLQIAPEPSNQVIFTDITWSNASAEALRMVDVRTDYYFADLDVFPSRLVEAGETVTIEAGDVEADFLYWKDEDGNIHTEKQSFTYTVQEDVLFEACFDEDGIEIEEDGEYIDPERVALYLHTYGELPGNYMAYDDFDEKGWDESELRDRTGNPLKSLGYKSFQNREGILPEEEGRVWRTADINFDGGRLRGIERLVFSDDGLIYYTDDHYDTYVHMYGEE